MQILPSIKTGLFHMGTEKFIAKNEVLTLVRTEIDPKENDSALQGRPTMNQSFEVEESSMLRGTTTEVLVTDSAISGESALSGPEETQFEYSLQMRKIERR